jgi:magnesium transporter
MAKRGSRRSRRPTPGSSPGVFIVSAESPKPVVRVMDYAPNHFAEKTLASPRDVVEYLQDATSSVTWVDVQGLGDRSVLEELASIFGVHRLALADVVNTPQRPKLETFDNHLFMITRMAMLTKSLDLQAEQVSLFLGRNFVLTFQETYGDCLDPVRERIRGGIGIVRNSGPDYLAYAILDAIVDQYFPVVEALGERIEALEDEVVTRPRPATLQHIYAMKRELLTVRRGIWPQRDIFNSLLRDESGHIGREVHVYLRDCYDHTVQLMDMVETLRELTSGLLDVYLSSIANRTNDIMKVLTVIASIFIPLTFIVGVYGMNFEVMPEIRWQYGYLAVWIVMILVAAGLLLTFARKGWLSRGSGDRPDQRDE